MFVHTKLIIQFVLGYNFIGAQFSFTSTVEQSSLGTDGTAQLFPSKATDGNDRTCSRTRKYCRFMIVKASVGAYIILKELYVIFYSHTSST